VRSPLAWVSAFPGAFAGWLRSVGSDRRTIRQDAIAAVPGAIGSVPDGMASAVLVGVNPVYGLYASFAGPIGGGLTASTKLMVITTTTAAALAAGSTLGGVDPSKRAEALFLLTVVAGVAMIAAGILRLGRYTRFVSLSVMIGFLTGVAVNIVFGQLSDLTGASVEGDVAIEKAWDLVTHPGRIEVSSLAIGLAALAILVVLARTSISAFSSVVALLVPSVVAYFVGGVAVVEDVGEIPHGVPSPHLPELGLVSFDLVTGALAIAVIVLVQGAGVSESAPNPDGSFADPNRDFVAQGVGNVAAGLFKGQPVGGSVGQTALNRAAGARTRWASILSGVWMLLILVAFSGIVGHVAMPTLAAILIFAAVGSIRTGEIVSLLRTGRVSQIALVTTFLATLLLPVTSAVGIGVALSLLLQLNREALDLSIVQLVRREDGQLAEQPAHAHLDDGSVTVLDVYGSLFYAGARTLQVRLPDPAGARSPVVVLRLRGRTTLGATAMSVIAGYGERLAAAGGRLYLSGVDPRVVADMHRAGRVRADGPVRTFEATEIVGESSRLAIEDAEAWLVREHAGGLRPASVR
jgi:SulP family sulfate permease